MNTYEREGDSALVHHIRKVLRSTQQRCLLQSRYKFKLRYLLAPKYLLKKMHWLKRHETVTRFILSTGCVYWNSPVGQGTWMRVTTTQTTGKNNWFYTNKFLMHKVRWHTLRKSWQEQLMFQHFTVRFSSWRFFNESIAFTGVRRRLWFNSHF